MNYYFEEKNIWKEYFCLIVVFFHFCFVFTLFPFPFPFFFFFFSNHGGANDGVSHGRGFFNINAINGGFQPRTEVREVRVHLNYMRKEKDKEKEKKKRRKKERKRKEIS